MNKNRYRIIFSKVKNMFVAVAENVKSQTKASGQTTAIRQHDGIDTTPFHQTWQVKSLVTSMSLMMSIAPVYAQITADLTANVANRPVILAGKNAQGTVVPVVNIQTPKNGVSHNIYKQFNVMAEGAVLNNSSTGGTTALVGTVAANPYLAKGTARVILNEVNSTAASQFKGNLVVAGQTADVIIANPSGINIQGGGFINTNKAIFTTGKPQLNADGSIKQFVVDQGKITVLGGTGSTTTTGIGLGGVNNDANYVDIYTRALDASAEIRAKQGINVITGANTISEDLSIITSKTSTAAAPTIAVDVKALGGMYANNIYIIGNDKGLGVTNAGKINAVNNLVITSAGKIENKGNLASTSATQGLVNIGTTQAGVNGDINNSGTILGKGLVNIESANNINHTANEIKVENGVISPLMMSAVGNITLSPTAKIKNFGTDKGDIYLDAKNIVVGETAEIGTNGSIYLDAKENITAAKSSALSTRYDLDLEAKNKITLESTALTGNNGNINIKTTNANKALSAITINNGSINSSKDLNIFSTGNVTVNQIGLVLESATNKVSRVKNLNLYSGNNLTLDFSTTVLPLVSGKVQAEATNKVELKGATLSTKDNINLQANQVVVGSHLNSQKEINLNAKVNDLSLTKNLTAVGNINVLAEKGGISATSLNATSSGGKVNLLSSKNVTINGTATVKSTLSGSKGVTVSSLNQGAIAVNNTNLTSSAGAILVNTEGKNTLTDIALNATGNIEIFAKDNLTLDGVTTTSKAHTALNSKKNVYINSSAGTADAPVFTSTKSSQLTSTGSLSVTSGNDINLQNTKLTGGAVLVEAGGSFNPNKAVELNATGSDLLKNNTKLSSINGDLTVQSNKTLNIDPKKLTLKAVGDIDLVSKAGDLNLIGYGGTTGNGSEQVVKLNTLGGGVNLEGKNINIEGSQITANKDIKIVSSEGNVVIGGVKNNFSNKVIQSKLNDYRLQKTNIENQIKLISTQFEADKKAIQQAANLFIIRAEETYNGRNGAEWGDFIKEKNAMYSLINNFEKKYNTKVNVREEWDEVDPDYLNSINIKYEQPFENIQNELKKEILLFENALNGYEHIGSNLKTASGNINITSNKGTQITGSEIIATNGIVNIEARAPLTGTYTTTTLGADGKAKTINVSIIMDGLADFYDKGKETDTNYSLRRLINPTVINGSKGVNIKAVGNTIGDNLVLQATGIVAQNGDVKIQANKNILFDAAVETSYDRSTTTEKKKSWSGLKKKYITTKVENEDANAASVDVQAKNIYIESKEQNPNNSIDIYSGKFTADGGKISIRSGGKLNFYTVEESSSSQTDITTKKSFAGIKTGTSKTSTTREVLSELPTKLKADYIGAKSGYDMRLEGTEFEYLKGATLESGGKIELFSAITKITDITKKEKSSIVWQSMQDKGSITETGKLPSFNGPTPPTFQAAGGLSVQIPVGEKDQNKVVIRDEILKLAKQPGNEYLKDFVNRKDVDWNTVILAQKDWDYKSQGLTGAGAAIIVIIVTVLTMGAGTAGAGAALFGTSTATGTAMTNAFVTSLATQASVSLVNNGGDLGKTLKDLGSKEAVRSLATSVVTAGLMSQVSTALNLKPDSSLFADRIYVNFVNSTGSALVSTAINGGSLSDNLEAALLNGLAMSIQSQLAGQIKGLEDVNYVLHKIAHAAAGCAAGAILKQCEAGAIGAAIGEIVAEEMLNGRNPTFVSEAEKVKIEGYAKLASGVVSAYAGYDVNAATQSSVTAIQNNAFKDKALAKLEAGKKYLDDKSKAALDELINFYKKGDIKAAQQAKDKLDDMIGNWASSGSYEVLGVNPKAAVGAMAFAVGELIIPVNVTDIGGAKKIVQEGVGQLSKAAKALKIRSSNGIQLDPRLPEPVAGYNYTPNTLNSQNSNIANSHINGYKSELQLANQIVAMRDQIVLKYGDAIGRHGADIISVDSITGKIYLWDAKFRSTNTKLPASPTFTNKSSRDKAVAEVLATINSSSLPNSVKQKALNNIKAGTFTTYTVATGNSKNSVMYNCINNVCK